MKTSKEIYTEERRKEVYGKYSPELDKCIDALRAAEDYRASYSEFKPKTGKWYKDNDYDIYSLFIQTRDVMCGFTEGKWSERTVSKSDILESKPADMKKVEKLLIQEAERRGFNKPQLYCDELWDEQKNGRGGKVIFDFKTGKWAEITRQPLYVNQYGTEFFEGDKVYWVVKSDFKINSDIISDDMCMYEDDLLSEAMTERECHRWIYENWEKYERR